MENLIINSLFENELYAKRVLPFLKSEYFAMHENRLILKIINAYVKEYSDLPSYAVIRRSLYNNTTLSQTVISDTDNQLTLFENEKKENYKPEWLFNEAEKHCKQHSIEQAIINSAAIIDNPDKANENISTLINDALKISFVTDIGINLFEKEDMSQCHDFYTSSVNKILCHLTKLNEVFYILKKTCTCILAPVHGGKTAALCSLSIGYVKNGYNVLYVSGEMQDKEIAKIQYANLMNITRNDMSVTDGSEFMGHYKSFKLRSKSWGRHVIKEYPPSTVSISMLEAYIDDVELKKGIKFDIIVLDYLNLFLPLTSKDSDNTYTSIKRVSEDFRSLCVRKSFAGLTATQTNRDGAKREDYDMTDTSESYGLPATMDAMIALIGTDDFKKQNIQIWKLIKNRFTGVVDHKIAFRSDFKHGRILDLDDKTDIPIKINNNVEDITKKRQIMHNTAAIVLDTD